MLLESCWCSARVTAEGIRDVWSKSRNAAHSTVTFAKKRDGDAMWVLIISFSQSFLTWGYMGIFRMNWRGV